MKRILLDTNVYGLLIFDRPFVDKLQVLIPSFFVVYSTSLIRKELRDISKDAKAEGRSKRNLVLSVHDSFIRKSNHMLEVNEFIILLANKYFEEYKKGGGALSIIEMLPDFTLVACATLYTLDLVVSNDNRTMLSGIAKRAYNVVNNKINFNTPTFYTYNSFREYVGRFQ